MAKYIFFMTCLMVSLQAHAFDEWTKVEIGMEAVYIAANIIDWGQTLDIADNPDRYREEVNCAMLGDHPSRGRVNKVFAAGLILQPLIAHVLPHDLRKLWILSGIALEVSCIHGNQSIGLRMGF